MKTKDILSIMLFIIFFGVSYILTCYLSLARQLGSVMVPMDYLVMSIKINVWFKVLVGLMFGIVGACIPRMKSKKDENK